MGFHSRVELNKTFACLQAAKQSLPAVPDSIRAGTVIHYYPDSFIDGYSKPGECRPGLVMAVWRDKEGRAKILETMRITTNKNTVLKEHMCAGFPGYERLFPKQVNMISFIDTLFVPNEVRSIKNHRPLSQELVQEFIPDFLVRRATALLWNKHSSLIGALPDQSLIRDGFAFGNIEPENIASSRWQPDILANGAKHTNRSERLQNMIDAVARFAYAHHIDQSIAGVERHSIPPHKDWPRVIPSVKFATHRANRDFDSRHPRSVFE